MIRFSRFCAWSTSLALVGALLLGAVAVAAAQESSQESSPDALRQYNRAVGLHNDGAYNLAAPEWKSFIETYPDDPKAPDAWHYLGVCHSKLNEPGKAVEAYQKVITGFPDSKLLEDTYLNLGLTQYNMAIGGKPAAFDDAAKTFETLVTKYPEGKYVIDATFYWAESLYNRGKKQESLPKYQEVVAKAPPTHPLYAQALFALGVNYTDLGQHKPAVESYDSFLEKFPESGLVPEVRMWRGESLYELGDYAGAEQAFATAAGAEGFANADFATVRQADALSAQKKFAEAAAVYASLPQKSADSQYAGLANLEAGKKYYLAKQWDEALSHLGKVLAAGGESAPEAAHWAARCHLQQKQPAEALKVVEQVLPSATDAADKRSLELDQADALFEIADKRAEAVAKYAAYAEAYPDDASAPQALYMAGFGSMNLGDYPKALEYAEKFLAAYPGHDLGVGVKHVKAESSLLTGKYAEAKALYDELLEAAPGDPDAEIWKVHRGTALYLQRKYQEAVESLTPVIAEVKAPELLAEAHYRVGRSHVALKQYEPAVAALEAALTAAPKWKLADDTLLVLAYAHQQTGKLDQARQAAQRVIDGFPSSKRLDEAHYRLAECARLSNQFKPAVAGYQTIVDTWPDSSLVKQAYYGLGWAQLGARDYAAAETAFSTLIEKFPDDGLVPRSRYGRGMCRRQLKKYPEAVEDMQAYLATDPTGLDKGRALHILGLSQKGLKEHDQAAGTFRRLLSEMADYPDADSIYFELGWSLKELDKGDEAAGAFQTLVEKFPESDLAADARYLVGDHHYDKKDYGEAAKSYYAAMQKAGKGKLGEEASYKLGLSYYLQNDYKNAQATFAYQVATWPEGPLASDGWFMQGESALKLDDCEKALECYDKVTKPTNPEVVVLKLLHASHCALKLEKFEKAIELANGLIAGHEESPHVTKAMYQKGRALQQLDRKDEALEVYNEVAKKADGESTAASLFMIGEIQFERKQHQEAIKTFYDVRLNYPFPKWQADATYEAARCFEVLKNVPTAVKLYQELVKKYPDSDKVPLAQERLKALQT